MVFENCLALNETNEIGIFSNFDWAKGSSKFFSFLMSNFCVFKKCK